MANQREIEARWINLDAKDIISRLKKIKAKKTGSYFFREWVFAHSEWRKEQRRIRVRTDGKKTWLTYKANASWEIDSTQEIEVTVSSTEEMVALLHAASIPLLRNREKKRETYELKGITFDIDFWPQIPMVLEIEAASAQKVREGAKLLGLEWKDALFIDQAEVHKKHYGIDLFAINEYKFKKK